MISAMYQLRSLLEWWEGTYHRPIPRLKISSRTAEFILDEIGITNKERRQISLEHLERGNAQFCGVVISTR